MSSGGGGDERKREAAKEHELPMLMMRGSDMAYFLL